MGFPVAEVVVTFFVMIIFCVLTNIIFNKVKCFIDMRFSKAVMLLLMSFWMILAFFIMAYAICKQESKLIQTMHDFWNNNKFSATSVFVGMGGNIIFGFIDNAGLFFGSTQLDDIFALLPGGSDNNVCAGQGNTQSDLLGATLGTFVGLILKKLTDVEENPIWSDIIGIVIGCLLGILIPKLILRNSKTMGLNKMKASTVMLGNMDIDELEELIENKKTLFDYRSEKLFRKLDVDDSNDLDVDEIKAHFKEGMGSEYSDEQFKEQMKCILDEHQEDDDKDKTSLPEFKKIQRALAKQMLTEKLKKDPEKKAKLKELNINIQSEDDDIKDN